MRCRMLHNVMPVPPTKAYVLRQVHLGPCRVYVHGFDLAGAMG
jgi:hypothetical protein